MTHSSSDRRLLDAADAVLAVVQKAAGPRVLRPSLLMRTTDVPALLRSFTVQEVEAAEAFLVRCDILRPHPRALGRAS
ncbi:MAG: hypothetical protein H6809_07365 [Phycisphaeraceae bacterium]|nr:hypothetical protein [Phycisphaeraceae bacterium]